MTTLLVLMYSMLLNLEDNPPGTMKVKNFYVDKTEIQNIHWLEYMHHKSKEIDSTQYQTLLPDSSNTWYNQIETRFQPIVLISYDQAVEFCKWRSETASKNFKKKITYRLPTPAEWREVAEEHLKTYQKKEQKELLKHIKSQQNFVQFNKKQRKNRLYNLFDSVSEMTQEENIAMGANSQSPKSIEQSLNTPVPYDSPKIFLGFRCIAEVEQL